MLGSASKALDVDCAERFTRAEGPHPAAPAARFRLRRVAWPQLRALGSAERTIAAATMGGLLSMFSSERQFAGFERSLERIDARITKAQVRAGSPLTNSRAFPRGPSLRVQETAPGGSGRQANGSARRPSAGAGCHRRAASQGRAALGARPIPPLRVARAPLHRSGAAQRRDSHPEPQSGRRPCVRRSGPALSVVPHFATRPMRRQDPWVSERRCTPERPGTTIWGSELGKSAELPVAAQLNHCRGAASPARARARSFAMRRRSATRSTCAPWRRRSPSRPAPSSRAEPSSASLASSCVGAQSRSAAWRRAAPRY